MSENMRRDYIWNTVGIFAQNAISPLLLIIITRINGIDQSGLFSFAFSVAIIFWALGMWGGRTYQVSDIRNEFSHNSYIMVRFVLAVAMLIGVIGFSLVNHYDATKTGILIALVLFKLLESISDAIYGILQVHSRLYMVGRSLTYKATLGFMGFMVIDYVTHSILLGSVAIIASNLAVIAVYDIRSAGKTEDIKLRLQQLPDQLEEALLIMRRSLPVFAVSFLMVFSLNIPRYFVDLYHKGEIGYFGILAMPITLIALLMSFILQPNVVRLTSLFYQKNYEAFRRIVTRLNLVISGVGLVVFIGALTVGLPALKLVFGVDFGSYKVALLIMVAGGLVNAFVSIFVNLLTIMRRFKVQFYTLLLSNILLCLACVVIVGPFGLIGGVSLFAVINVVQLLVLIVIYNKIVRKKVV